MKKLFISYTVFTIIWPLLFVIFSEKNFMIPVVFRIALLYFWGILILLSLVLIFISLRKKSDLNYRLYLVILIILNVIMMIGNPFNIVTNFFG